MAKALLGHVRGPDQRLAAELRRLRRRIGDLEAQLARLEEGRGGASFEGQATPSGPATPPEPRKPPA
jgi:hypothetical protein